MSCPAPMVLSASACVKLIFATKHKSLIRHAIIPMPDPIRLMQNEMVFGQMKIKIASISFAKERALFHFEDMKLDRSPTISKVFVYCSVLIHDPCRATEANCRLADIGLNPISALGDNLMKSYAINCDTE